jgi:hypothetical protein
MQHPTPYLLALTLLFASCVRQVECRTKLFVGGTASTRATVRDAFIRDVCAPGFARKVLHDVPGLESKVANAQIRQVTNSSLVEVVVWALDHDSSVAASRLLSEAVIATADPDGTRDLRVAFVSPPSTQ